MTRSVFSDRYKLLRQVVVEARRSAGLTQVQLARKLGRPQSFVSKYELGERRLDVIEFLDVAAALGIKPEAVLRKVRDETPGSASGQ